jgi:hypothetical protein
MARNQPYNGHKNWTHWNVALWLGNDESLYNLAMEYRGKTLARSGKPITPRRAAYKLQAMLPAKTPDGASYSITALTAAIEGLWE